MKACPRMLHAALVAILVLAPRVHAQKKPVTQPIVAAALAGQTVALLPANLVIVEPTVPADVALLKRPALFRWVDSVVHATFEMRAPDVKWVPAAELRRLYRRSGGLLPDPDQMGQSVMKIWSLDMVPDPLRSNLRRLLATANGSRLVFIPASLSFGADSTGQLKAELAAVLADVRTGKVVWRSIAKGGEGTPEQVLGKALATIFPSDEGQ